MNNCQTAIPPKSAQSETPSPGRCGQFEHSPSPGRIKAKLWLILISAVLFTTLPISCTLFEESGEVVARVQEPSMLLLYNVSVQNVSYVVYDEDVLAKSFIFDVSSWPTIGAGQKAEIPFEEIVFYSENTRRLMIRWAYKDRGGGFIRLTIGE